jgi:hypothetical protein
MIGPARFPCGMVAKASGVGTGYTTVELATGLPSILTDTTFYLGTIGQRSKLVELMLRIAIAGERTHQCPWARSAEESTTRPPSSGTAV